MWQAPLSDYIKENESSLSQKFFNRNSLKSRCERLSIVHLFPTNSSLLLKQALKTNKKKIIIIW